MGNLGSGPLALLFSFSREVRHLKCLSRTPRQGWSISRQSERCDIHPPTLHSDGFNIRLRTRVEICMTIRPLSTCDSPCDGRADENITSHLLTPPAGICLKDLTAGALAPRRRGSASAAGPTRSPAIALRKILLSRAPLPPRSRVCAHVGAVYLALPFPLPLFLTSLLPCSAVVVIHVRFSCFYALGLRPS